MRNRVSLCSGKRYVLLVLVGKGPSKTIEVYSTCLQVGKNAIFTLIVIPGLLTTTIPHSATVFISDGPYALMWWRTLAARDSECTTRLNATRIFSQDRRPLSAFTPRFITSLWSAVAKRDSGGNSGLLKIPLCPSVSASNGVRHITPYARSTL